MEPISLVSSGLVSVKLVTLVVVADTPPKVSPSIPVNNPTTCYFPSF